MAKRAKKAAKGSGADDATTAVVLGAVKRAESQIKKALSDDKARPDAGGHAVNLTITIEGDIDVGAAVPEGEPKQVPMLVGADLLAGVLAGVPAKERADLLDKAAKRLASDSEAMDRKIVQSYALIESSIPELAVKHGHMDTRSSPARAGSIKGSPRVLVEGSVGSHQVSVAVDDEAEAVRAKAA